MCNSVKLSSCNLQKCRKFIGWQKRRSAGVVELMNNWFSCNRKETDIEGQYGIACIILRVPLVRNYSVAAGLMMEWILLLFRTTDRNKFWHGVLLLTFESNPSSYYLSLSLPVNERSVTICTLFNTMTHILLLLLSSRQERRKGSLGPVNAHRMLNTLIISSLIVWFNAISWICSFLLCMEIGLQIVNPLFLRVKYWFTHCNSLSLLYSLENTQSKRERY